MIKKLVMGLSLAFVGMSTTVQAQDFSANGWLGRTLFGDKLEKEYGITIGGWAEIGLAYNNSSEPSGKKALANSPVAINRDEGGQLNQLGLYIDKSINSTVIPRVGPFPGPVSDKADFGFHATMLYGRDAQVVQTFGWDNNLGVNRDGVNSPFDRHNYVTFPELYAKMYLPIGLGVSAYVGNFFSPIGTEIGTAERPTPNFFYTRTYAFVSSPIKHTGALVAANLMRSEQSGYISGELGLVRGWSNVQDNNNSNSIIGALRWRSPNLATWVDYEFITGNEQNDMSRLGGPQMPVSRIMSPRDQNKTHHVLSLSHQFTPQWRGELAFVYGKQKGDGARDTIDAIYGPGFNGASWSGYTASVIYQHKPDLAYGARFEYFSDKDGFALTGAKNAWNMGVKSDYNALTLGARWDVNKHVTIRPELRHDWQSSNNGQKAFAGGTKDSQTTLSADLVVYF